ncbi:hypothetical protein NUW54_g13722 [Trametes sanguinea]|uniref:Uncharacterized protein n=1 Tax=Trametes sanguinea TaxID=158606 RepID=A0ACC1MIU9_9APHY|nr:hypothetical protein NUW54_g13722 [Trametes sanguinea]
MDPELLDTRMRRIRNIDFCSQEIETLLPHCTQKIVGTTIDAFAAILQDGASQQGHDYCMFSSWIPAIVSGRERDGGHAGTIQDHILFACDDQNTAVLRSRARWAFPMCGGDPAHWVLGWVDWPAKAYGIVDSIPEIESASWAAPLVRNCADRIRQEGSMSSIDWSTLQLSLRSPEASEQQVDGWSCGLFVIGAIKAFVNNWQSPIPGESAKEDVRAEALRSFLNVLVTDYGIRDPHAPSSWMNLNLKSVAALRSGSSLLPIWARTTDPGN